MSCTLYCAKCRYKIIPPTIPVVRTKSADKVTQSVVKLFTLWARDRRLDSEVVLPLSISTFCVINRKFLNNDSNYYTIIM